MSTVSVMSNLLKCSKQGKELEISLAIPSGINEIQVRLYSSRNNEISKLSDESPYKPKIESVSKPSQPASAGNFGDLGYGMRQDNPITVFFPVVDVSLEPGMEAVVRLSDVTDGYFVINGTFNKFKEQLQPENTIPAGMLEHWENNFFVSTAITIQSFFLRQTFRVSERINFRHFYNLLSANWDGTIEVYAVQADGLELLAKADIVSSVPQTTADQQQQQLQVGGLSSEQLLQALEASFTYIQNTQNRNPSSPFYRGLYLLYDHDAKTYRAPQWIWSWGPAVKLLIEAGKMPRFANRGLQEIGEQIGKTSLLFTKRHLDHPAKAIPTSRWKAGSQFEYGVIECHSAADANFLSGWAWIPLYEATGNTDFLKAAVDLTSATESLISEYEIAPMDYLEEPPSWTNWSIDEIGFATEGISELYRVTGDDKYRAIGEKYINQVLSKLERPDGLWNRSWLREERIALECEYMTRGLGWGMEGLLAAHRMSPDAGYLAKAEKMAASVIGLQKESGCWAHYCNQTLEEAGAAEKATSLWSLMLYRLYKETNNPVHLDAARKALHWCVANTYSGPDLEGAGGIIGCTPHSGVVYRQWFHLSCTYTSAFFGLAIIEELKLQGLQ